MLKRRLRSGDLHALGMQQIDQSDEGQADKGVWITTFKALKKRDSAVF